MKVLVVVVELGREKRKALVVVEAAMRRERRFRFRIRNLGQASRAAAEEENTQLKGQ